MPKNKKPRKRYVPKVVPSSPLAVVAANNSPITADEQVGVSLAVRSAFQALVDGRGTHAQWMTVTAALNIASKLDELTFGSQCASELRAAIHAHAHCGARPYLGGKFGYTGPELQVMRMALEIHDAQIEQINFKEIRTATEAVEEAIRHRRFETSARQVAQEMKKT